MVASDRLHNFRGKAAKDAGHFPGEVRAFAGFTRKHRPIRMLLVIPIWQAPAVIVVIF